MKLEKNKKKIKYKKEDNFYITVCYTKKQPILVKMSF